MRTRDRRDGWRLVEKLTGYYAERGKASVRICSTKTDGEERVRMFGEFVRGQR